MTDIIKPATGAIGDLEESCATTNNTPNAEGESQNSTENIETNNYSDDKKQPGEQGTSKPVYENGLNGPTEEQAEKEHQSDPEGKNEEALAEVKQSEVCLSAEEPADCSAAKEVTEEKENKTEEAKAEGKQGEICSSSEEPADCAAPKKGTEEKEDKNEAGRESTGPEELAVVKETLNSHTEGLDIGLQETSKEEASEKHESSLGDELTKNEGEGREDSEELQTKSCTEIDTEQEKQSFAEQQESKPEEKKRSVTVDDPEDLVELCAKSGQPAVEDEGSSAQHRSRTFGPGDEAPTEASPDKTQSRTIWYDDVEETPETVSYSTRIVGGVVHKVPLESSPKAQPKSPKSAGQQSQGILRNLGSLFGKRRKSKTESARSLENKTSKDAESAQATPPDPGEAPPTPDDSLSAETEDSREYELNKDVGTPEHVEKPAQVECVESTQVTDGEKTAEPTEVDQAKSAQEERVTDGEEGTEPTEVDQAKSAQDERVADGEEGTEPTEVDQAKSAQDERVTDGEEGTEPTEVDQAKSAQDERVTDGEEGTEPTEVDQAKSAQEERVMDGEERAEPTEVDQAKSAQDERVADAEEGTEPTDVQNVPLVRVETVTDGEHGSETAAPAVESTQEESGATDERAAAAEPEVQNVESVQQESTPGNVVNDEKSSLEEATAGAEGTEVKDEHEIENAEEDVGQVKHEIAAQEDEKKEEKEVEQQQLEVGDVKSDEDSKQTLHNGTSEQTPVRTNMKSDIGIDDSRSDQSSPEPTEPEASKLKESVVQRQTAGSYSPKTQRMQMRVSYAERTPQGDLEVEIISSPERVVHKRKASTKSKSAADVRISCRELGEVDHEGWLIKRGGNMIFASWKRKWVVLKEEHLYYYKTSFDMEAGGIIPLAGCVIQAAPDAKKKFCFTCEQPGVKAGKVFFAADNKEDMDKWLDVLSLASRGEPIIKTSSPLKVDQGSFMRKKTNSVSKTKRSESVLGLGGRFDGFLDDQEDNGNTCKKSPTRGSVNKDERESDKEAKSPAEKSQECEHTESSERDSTGVATIGNVEAESPVSNTESTDIRNEPSPMPEPEDSCDGVHDASVEMQQQAECESAIRVESVKPGEDFPATVVTTGGSVPQQGEGVSSGDEVAHQQVEGTPSGDDVTPKVGVTPDPPVDVASTGEEMPPEEGAVPSSTSEVQAATSEVENALQPSEEVRVLDENTTQTAQVPTSTDEAEPVQHREEALAVDADSIPQPAEKISSDSHVAPQPSEDARLQDETITQPSEAAALISGAPSANAATDDSKPRPSEETPAVTPAPSKESATPTKENLSRASNTGTTWYCLLDSQKDTWALPGDDSENSKPQGKNTVPANRKSNSDEDQLMELCRTVNASRLSIVGYPLLDGPDRLRAMSTANKEKKVSQNILKLRALERSLKDKQRDVSSCDELLSTQVNRQSIADWVQEHPHLSSNVEDKHERQESKKEQAPVEELDTHL